MSWRNVLAALGMAFFSAALVYAGMRWLGDPGAWTPAIGTGLGVLIGEAWSLFRRRRSATGL